jgi:hypothetical protein
MINITNETASANILAACDAGTLVQGKWHDRRDDGRELACLLGSINSTVNSWADCNGDLMPMWLAEMVPTLFDGLPEASIIPVARRFGIAVARWHVLAPTQWDAILTRVLIRCVDDAVGYARPVCAGEPYWLAVVSACDLVTSALSGKGDIEAAAEAGAAAGTAACHKLFTFVLDQIEAEIAAADGAKNENG